MAYSRDPPAGGPAGLAPPGHIAVGGGQRRRYASPNGRLPYVRHGSSSSIGSNGPSPLRRDMLLPSADPSDHEDDYPAHDREPSSRGVPISKRRSPQLGVAQYLARGLSMSSADLDSLDGASDDADTDDDFDFEAKLSQIRPPSASSSSDDQATASSSIGSFEFLKSPPIVPGAPTTFDRDPTTPRPGQHPSSSSSASSAFTVPPPRGASATVRRTGVVPAGGGGGGWKFPPREDSTGALSSPLASYTSRSHHHPASSANAPPHRNESFAASSMSTSSTGGSAPSSRPTSPSRYRTAGPRTAGPSFSRAGSTDDAFARDRPFRGPGGISDSPTASLARVAEERTGSPPPPSAAGATGASGAMSSQALLDCVRQMRHDAVARRVDPIPTPGATLTADYVPNSHSRTNSGASVGSDELPYGGTESPLRRPSQASFSSFDEHASPSPFPPPGPSLPQMGAETVDLSHRKIVDLSLPVVQELAEFVERLALGYNYLPILPPHFALLGETLRYLNLRGNHMEVFPEVLTRMPSMEILDVSRNKIKAMPRRPGTLDHLRVLSISQNRVRRLPNYVASLHQLRVFKLDHNPIVWPPREITTFVETPPPTATMTEGGSMGGTSSMGLWLRNMQDWMRKNPYVRPPPAQMPRSAGYEDVDGGERIRHKPTDSFEDSPTIPSQPEMTPQRSLFLLSPSSASTRSPGFAPEPSSGRQHVRNASASIVGNPPEVHKRPELRMKKSLPDLRRNHGDIMVERRADLDAFSPPPPSSTAGLSPRPVISDQGSPVLTERGGGNRTLPTSGSVRFNELEIKGHERDGATRRTGEGKMQVDRNSGAYFRRLSMLPASTISKQVPESLLQLVDAVRGILFSLSQIYAALKQFVVFASYDRLPDAISRVMESADESMGKLINALDRFDACTRRGSPDGSVVRLVFEAGRENVSVFGTLVGVLGIQLKVLVGSADVRYSRTLLLNLYGSATEIALAWATITPLIPQATRLLFPTGTPTHPAAVRLQPPTPSPMAEPADVAASPGKVAMTPRAHPTSPPPGTRPKARRHAGSFSVQDVRAGAAMPSAFNVPDMPSPPPSMASLMTRAALESPIAQTNSGPISRLASRVGKGPLGLQLPSPATGDPGAYIPPSPFGPPPSLPAPSVDGPDSGNELAVPRSAAVRSVTPTSGHPGPIPYGASRTDQDFLDMTDVTSNIAVSVSTLLVEILGRAVTESDARTGGSAASSGRKARELMDLCESELEITRRLRLSLTRVKGLGGGSEEHGGSGRGRVPSCSPMDARRLYEDSTAFVKIIIQMANLARAAMLEYPLPKPVREGLGQLTKATKELATLLAVSSFKPGGLGYGPAAGSGGPPLHGLGVSHLESA